MQRVVALYQSTIGKKVLMALSGAAIFGYLIVHMIGNLQIFLGPDVINRYAALLHDTPVLLWAVRIVLLVAFPVHIAMAVQLNARNRQARPVPYASYKRKVSSYGARTMMFSGPFLLVFLLFHLAHLTLGVQVVPSAYVEGDVYLNMVNGFTVPWVFVFYVAAASLVGLHMVHGAWSMFQTLGVSHPRYNGILKEVAFVATVVVAGGFALVPLAVFLKLVGAQ
ncbi:MAG: succinate dehydrogenase cytochrome b subunit [Myxococcales bacterium]|nr:succinate dehydrogenase cytochrome b subunit [Myxococcales bacterium]